MTVKVEKCVGGSSTYFRLTFPYGSITLREFILQEYWSRRTATEARDVLEKVYHFRRNSIKFKHV
jgi:hypothetical protein